jgi:hypothetical protein
MFTTRHSICEVWMMRHQSAIHEINGKFELFLNNCPRASGEPACRRFHLCSRQYGEPFLGNDSSFVVVERVAK